MEKRRFKKIGRIILITFVLLNLISVKSETFSTQIDSDSGMRLAAGVDTPASTYLGGSTTDSSTSGTGEMPAAAAQQSPDYQEPTNGGTIPGPTNKYNNTSRTTTNNGRN